MKTASQISLAGALMRYATTVGLVAAVLLLVPNPNIAQQADQGSVARRALSSVVTIRAYGADGEQERLGSGFFIEDGRLVTNSHVVAGAEWVEVSDQDGELLGTVPYAEVISTRSDIAILPAPQTDLSGLPIASYSPQPGQKVWVVGSPEGLHGSVSDGVISAVRTVDGQGYLQISAPISSGSSGGPILDDQGRVIGIVASYISNGQNLNFGILADRLSALVNSPTGKYSFQRIRPPESGTTSEEPAEAPNSSDVVDDSPLLALPVHRQDELGPSDYESEDRYVDLYRIEGEAGQTLTVSMRSQQVDTQVALIARSDLGEEDPWGESDDDGGEGTNSMLTVTLPESGEYLLFATSYGKETGPYEVTVIEGEYSNQTDENESGRGGRWRHFSTSSDDSEWYYDPETVVEEYDETLVWVRVLHEDTAEYDKSLYRWGVDCESREFRLKSYVNYVDEELVDRDEDSNPEWNSVPPGSIAEHLVEQVCSR